MSNRHAKLDRYPPYALERRVSENHPWRLLATSEHEYLIDGQINRIRSIGLFVGQELRKHDLTRATPFVGLRTATN